MKRFTRFGRNCLQFGLTTLLCVGSGNWVSAQTAQANPLRPVSKTASRPTQPAAAIGTAVRTEKRTPDVVPAAARSVTTTRSHRGGSGVETAAYRRNVGRANPVFVPAHQDYMESTVLKGTVSVQQHGGEVIDGGTIYADGADAMVGDFDHGSSCGDGCGGCGGNGCNECCLVPCPQIPWDDLTIFGGAQGFTGPKNLGQAASFGFHEGFNWGGPVPCFNGCLGMQVGARFTQNNLSGSSFSPETRHQTFVTAGLFRRVDCGIQFGAAFDYLADNWYTDTELTQVRGELSWVFPCSHELGFWMTASLDEATAETLVFVNQIPVAGVASWEATDLYAIFYRHQFCGWEGANGRLFAGFSGESDGFIGTDLEVPLTTDLALQAGFAYLVPEETKGPAGIGNEQESWNVGISLVWYPGCGTATGKSYFSPLFNVADNGSFMVDQIQ